MNDSFVAPRALTLMSPADPDSARGEHSVDRRCSGPERVGDPGKGLACFVASYSLVDLRSSQGLAPFGHTVLLEDLQDGGLGDLVLRRDVSAVRAGLVLRNDRCDLGWREPQLQQLGALLRLAAGLRGLHGGCHVRKPPPTANQVVAVGVAVGEGY